jgi:hypothetical protein
MLKHLIRENHDASADGGQWLDLSTVTAEISSEEPNHPIECALVDDSGEGWRAAEPGVQTIRLLFDQPQDVRRIHVSFVESANARTQEFVLRWSGGGHGLKEIVRQQWNFSPNGAVEENEDYEVALAGATVIELTVNPDIRDSSEAYASLRRLRLA